MSGTASVSAEVAEEEQRDWQVRPARADDAPAVAAAVASLLRELGAAQPAPAAVEAVATALLGDPSAGTVVVATAAADDRELLGVLAASWQLAIHVPGRYGLVQDLWVHPAWRGRAVGAALVQRLVAEAIANGISRLEVGIPRDDFPQLAATRRFYERCGFALVGARLRWRAA